MKKISFLLLIIFTAGIASAQLYRLENNRKFGLNSVVLDGATIKIKQLSVDNEAVKSEAYNGGSLFYERVVRSQFGFLGSFGILRRNIDARVLSVNTSIEEKITLFRIAGRSYFSRHRSRGFNFQVGSDINYFIIESDFKVANDILSEKKSSTTLLTYGIFAGFDWLVKNTGIRLNIGYMFGSSVDNEEIEDIHITYEFDSVYVQFGTFAFF